MTITIGWWAVPAVITLLAIANAFLPIRDDNGSGIGAAVVGAFHLMLGLCLALASWLIWALVA